MTGRLSRTAASIMAVAAAAALFVALYVAFVRPERAAADAARTRAASLERERAGTRPLRPAAHNATAGDAAAEVADSLHRVMAAEFSRGMTGASVDVGIAQSQPIPHTPIVVTFESDRADVERFFAALRVLPAACRVASVAMVPGQAGRVKATTVLLVFPSGIEIPRSTPTVAAAAEADVRAVAPPPVAVPVKTYIAEPPDPVVATILYSASRRLAVVNGRIVSTGDRVGSLLIGAIEEESVVLTGPSGARRRVRLDRPAITRQ